jgi:hypothetical protein
MPAVRSCRAASQPATVVAHSRTGDTRGESARSIGSLGLGSVGRRRNSRFGETCDRTMTVTEWAPPSLLGFDIRDGASPSPLTNFEPVGEGRTRVTIWVDMHDPRRFDSRHGPPDRSPWPTWAICWTRLLGAESAPRRLGVGRRYVSSAPYVPD